MPIEQELKRIADRLEMIHNHLVKLPEQNPKLDVELEEQEEAEEQAEAPKPKKNGKKAPEPVKEKEVTEEDVRIAANAMIKSAIKSVGGDKTKGVAEGKKHVKRVLGEFDCEKIEDLTEDQFKNAVRAFERVAGTFAPDAETSDDLDI